MGSGGLHVSKERGILRRVDEKKWGLMHLSALCIGKVQTMG